MSLASHKCDGCGLFFTPTGLKAISDKLAIITAEICHKYYNYMSLASHKCDGCGLFFTPTGLNSHIRQTRNNNCRSWRNEYLPQVDERLDNGTHSDDDEPPQDFEGDLYGNDYEEEDFPGFNDPPRLPADSSDDEDMADNDEDGWEPEPLDQPAGGIGYIPPPVILDPAHSNRHESHNRLCRKPTIRLFNDRPDRNAGAPLEDMTKTSYETYQDALPKANSVPNIWEPFASKIDWEIAMWAKLRGPSSTALSELLNVEGVSVLFSVSAQRDTNYLLAAQYLGPLIQLCKRAQ